MLSVKVLGVPELQMKLRNLEVGLQGKLLQTAAQAGAFVIANRWKELAPYRTGTYRRSIHVEPGQVSADAAEVVIGTDLTDPPYPYFLEYGTRYMAARPSMRPAFDEKRDEAIRVMTEAARQLVLTAVRLS